MLKKLISLLALLALLAASGCTVIDRSVRNPVLEPGAKWVLLPLANHSETAQASLRAEAVLEVLLRQRGMASLLRPPAAAQADPLADGADRKTQEAAQRWALEQGARYAISGAVDEWRYKVGVDGEPVVGIVLQAVDLRTQTVVWTAAGARSGWSRESLSAVAQKLMRDMLGEFAPR